MSWLWAALMPHPPVVVPEVGKGREREAQATRDGIRELVARVQSFPESPETLIVLSPHLPQAENALFINTAPAPKGSLARFGAPAAGVSLATDGDLLAALIAALGKADIPCAPAAVPDITPDHGSTVPLLMLANAFSGKKLPRVILANPCGLPLQQCIALGAVLRALQGDHRFALLASGDLSHRLRKDGPYGFHPAGPVFDNALKDALAQGSPKPLLELAPATLAGAGECGLRPALVLLGLAKNPVEVLSYEGPFGVGYCTAFCGNPHIRSAATAGTKAAHMPHPYVRLARMAVAALLSGAPQPDQNDIAGLSPDGDIWNQRKGCFVSIKTRDGALRGCIGTFAATQSRLDKEILANAAAASTRDPRFPSMQAGELDNVVFSVDVLNAPERVLPGMELNPARYGVIVVKDGRRGLLLPDLPGVETVEMQVGIAAQKAGIADPDGAEIYRFTVDRFPEDPQ